MPVHKSIYKFSETLLLFYKKEADLEILLEKSIEMEKLLKKEKGFKEFLCNNQASYDDKKAFVSEAAKALGMDGYVKNTLCSIIDHNFARFVDDFFSILIEELYVKLKIKLIFVSSTVELTEQQKKRLVNGFAKRFDSKIIPTYSIDKSLILGIRVKYDDVIEEFSLNSKLNQLIKELRKHIIKCPITF